MKPFARVLDLGCGTGSQAIEMAWAGFRVVAVDVDFDAVSTGRAGFDPSPEAHPVPDFLVADAALLPFAEERFDAVVCFDVLHWAADREAFRAYWSEAWRVLRKGGLFRVRCLLRDALPTAVALADGRYRLETGAVWFLPSRDELDEALRAYAGEWVSTPTAVGTAGAATMLARKSG